ncbi:MAG: hypothetical protein ACE5R4_18110 [Armatimonadota bacterium]
MSDSPVPPSLPLRDLLSDLVAAVAAADAELEVQGEPFVIPRARVSTEFVLSVDRRKTMGFLLWAKTSGSQHQARASVELELNAAPPAQSAATEPQGVGNGQEGLTQAELRQVQVLLLDRAAPALREYMEDHDLRPGQPWNAHWQIAMLRGLRQLGWIGQRPRGPNREALAFLRSDG